MLQLRTPVLSCSEDGRGEQSGIWPKLKWPGVGAGVGSGQGPPRSAGPGEELVQARQRRVFRGHWRTAAPRGMFLGGAPLPALLGPRVPGDVFCRLLPGGHYVPLGFLASLPGRAKFWLAPRTGLKAPFLKIAGPHLSSALPPGVSQES